MTFLAIRKLLAGVPWQLWAGIALLAAFWLYGNHQYNAGKQVVIERLETAEAKAKADAIKAAASADNAERARVVKFETEQATLEKVIDDAQANNSNALDALFGGL